MTARDSETPASASRRNLVWRSVPIVGFLLFCTIETIAIFALIGRFGFTLDDAYIHLSLAENIAQGHYGVNPGEPSSPSSSPMWAVLLVPFEWLGLGVAGALALNLLAGLGVVVASNHAMRLTFDTQEHPHRQPIAAAATLIFLAATNLVPLVFMGMEHTAQLLCSVAVALGLFINHRDGKTPWWFIAAIVIGPLLRYENLAISVPAIGWLALSGRRLIAVVCAATIAAGLGGFSAFLLSLGLEPLPNSVLAKASAGGDLVSRIGANFGENLLNARQAVPLLILMLVLTARGMFGETGGESRLALWAASAGLLHMVAGQFGWYSRYEIYIWATLLLTTILIFRSHIVAVVAAHPATRVLTFTLLATFAIAPEYIGQLLTTPPAAASINDQQRQLHLLVTEHLQRPVAANDIGWLTYQNPHHVLDIVGLASQAARVNLENHSHTRWVDSFIRERGVDVVIAYEMAVADSAKQWTPIGSLTSTRPNITAASDTVWIYAVDEKVADEIRPGVRAFANQLPPSVKLNWHKP